MLSAGSLEDRIVFVEAMNRTNEFGEEITTWSVAYRCRARVVYKRGSRALDCGEVWNPNTISVSIRYTRRVDEGMRIRWNGGEYHISSLNASRSSGDVTITAEKIQAEKRVIDGVDNVTRIENKDLMEAYGEQQDIDQ